MKRDLVAADEFDRGSRQLLNLGHSFGHAVEKCSDYAVPHGCGVAIGMAIIARAAAKRGICTDDTCAQILALLRQYGLPTETAFTRDALTDAARSDKKIADGKLHLIVPERIGCTAMVSAPCWWAARATIGLAPVPVPPPSPQVTNTMSEPLSASSMSDW